MTSEQLMEVNKGIQEWGLENVENIILIKSGVTNGNVIKAIFNPNRITRMNDDTIHIDYDFTPEWWDEPYQKGSKE
ncbi:MAG: hypothetical protein J6S85_16990 [Methanobrevibacter sp.]|nr:hypothetical protein [Methanobrevibacter sp.]